MKHHSVSGLSLFQEVNYLRKGDTPILIQNDTLLKLVAHFAEEEFS